MAEIVDKNPRNGDKPAGTAKRSKFQIKKHLWGTYRFGEYGVNRVINALTAGTYRINNNHDLRTYTLKAPLMAPISMYKDYFQVPKMAVLPKNWEKLYTQPKIGGDVDFDKVGTYLPAETWNAFLNRVDLTLVNTRNTLNLSENYDTYKTNLVKFLYGLFIAEKIYSAGSLINALGYKSCRLYSTNIEGKNRTFDYTFDYILNTSMKDIGFIRLRDADEATYKAKDYSINPAEEPSEVATANLNKIHTKHELVERLREGETIIIDKIFDKYGVEFEPDSELPTIDISLSNSVQHNLQRGIDIIRLWAYQIICAEFYTSDTVDYVYSAELFRQLISNYINNGYGTKTFTLNGLKYEYDYLSSFYFTQELQESIDRGIGAENPRYYFTALFKYNRTLKYKDYFVGSRTRPLAVGNTDVEINEQLGTVSVINITKGIQGQRFLNAVNKFARNIKDYVKGLLGIEMKIDWHQPLWLASTRDVIGTQEVENTGEAQQNENNSVTTVLRSGSGNYQINCDVDRDSIIMGITHFDIERAYWKGANRTFFQRDRADWWNPYLQYTGDQEIYGIEYDLKNKAEVFSYQGAYEEYKQEVNEAFGGFIENLPGYIFIEDEPSTKEDAPNYEYPEQLTPDFIRAKNSEFDRFYISLTGNSMGSYFHFIIDNYTDEEEIIPLATNPEIL